MNAILLILIGTVLCFTSTAFRIDWRYVLFWIRSFDLLTYVFWIGVAFIIIGFGIGIRSR